MMRRHISENQCGVNLVKACCKLLYRLFHFPLEKCLITVCGFTAVQKPGTFRRCCRNGKIRIDGTEFLPCGIIITVHMGNRFNIELKCSKRDRPAQSCKLESMSEKLFPYRRIRKIERILDGIAFRIDGSRKFRMFRPLFAADAVIWNRIEVNLEDQSFFIGKFCKPCNFIRMPPQIHAAEFMLNFYFNGIEFISGKFSDHLLHMGRFSIKVHSRVAGKNPLRKFRLRGSSGGGGEKYTAHHYDLFHENSCCFYHLLLLSSQRPVG